MTDYLHIQLPPDQIRGISSRGRAQRGDASRAQYQQATALEALLGWLHLSGRHDRVEQLFAVMMEEE